MACKYTYEGITYNSFAELVKFLSTKNILEWNSMSDIVFSKFLDRDNVYDLIQSLRLSSNFNKREETNGANIQTLLDGEPIINAPGTLSIQLFIDSPACVVDGEPLVTPLKEEDFLVNEAKILQALLEISEEEALNLAKKLLDNWHIIEEDAIDLHSLYNSKIIGQKDAKVEDFELAAESFKSDRLKGNIKVLDSLFLQLQNFYITTAGMYPERRTIKNLNVKAKINDIGTEIIGHIDYLFIDKFGCLHLYKFKTSEEEPKNWNKTKERKYKYDLAFLKQMLAYNGINVKNMTLDIVPVLLTYNNDFTNISDIKVFKPKNYNLGELGKELTPYINKVKKLILAKVTQVNLSDDFAQNADIMILATFPTLNLKSEGIAKSAKDWIRFAPESSGHGALLVIKPVGQENHAYDVIIGDKVYPIKSAKNKNRNEEIYEIVKNNLDKFEEDKSLVTQALKNALDESVSKGISTFNKVKGFSASSQFLSGIFYPYIHKKSDKEGASKKSDWTLLEDLLKYNIFAFRNKSGLVDIISLSALNLNSEANIKEGTSNILGAYKYDSQINTLNNLYGNVETIRTLLLLNEIIPKLNDGNLKLGDIKVISPVMGGSARTYNIKYLADNYLPTIFKVVKEKNKNVQNSNNFKGDIYINLLDLLLSEYNLATETLTEADKNEFDSTIGFLNLIDADSKAVLLIQLKNIMQNLSSLLVENRPDAEKRIPTMVNDLKISNEMRLKAKLYIMASNAYQEISGEFLNYEKPLSSIDTTIYTAPTVPNKNVQIVVNNFLTTVDSIASNIESEYDSHLRKFIMKYYKDIGYSATLNALIGNQAMLYDNMYELDELGHKKMIFKNPYDYSNDLKLAEREFLKNALYLFYRIHLVANGNELNLDKDDSEAMLEHIQKHPNYLNVPLIRASNASKLLNKERIKNAFRNVGKIISNPKQWYQEFVDNLTEEEKSLLDEDLRIVLLSNMFENQQAENSPLRDAMIQNHGSDYFETNVENILIEYLATYIRTQKMNDMLIGTKSLLLLLSIMGENSGTAKITEKEIEYIKNYLKINIFKRSIMEETSLKMVGLLQPLRTAISHANLAGNVVGYFRDNINGFAENFMRAITNFQTDLELSDVKKAYEYVIPNSMNNAMNVTLLSKLCLKYRLSNTDLARITERLKTGRGGIYNYDNWAYSTLRSPDFMNRMVLFVAKCMHDGCWDAYSIKDDKLIYNWKKDKRFSKYAVGDKSNLQEYNKLRSLYLSKVREWNNEHQDNPLEVQDDNFYYLPSPYSDLEILSIKNVANNIYGSYDKSTRAMGEHMALGWVFGMYTTWMNGIWNNYMLKPGVYNVSERDLVLETDENGNLLFFDEYGGLTTENTGLPIWTHKPMIMQGIFYMLKDMFHILNNDGKDALKEYINGSESTKQNLRKLLADLLVVLLSTILIKVALDPAYKDYKKEMKNNPIILNLITEVLYKSSTRAFDSFQGPLNIIQYFGENMNPPMYLIPVKVITDAGKFAFGDKTFMQLVTNNFAIMRSYKDTYNAYRTANSE